VLLVDGPKFSLVRFLPVSLPGSVFFSWFLPRFSLFLFPLGFLIFSGFIAREYQPFETNSKPLLPETAPEEEGEESDEQLLKTAPFVRWK